MSDVIKLLAVLILIVLLLRHKYRIGNFLLAAFIMYLIMAALFENFIYPLLILSTLPLSL